MGVMSILMYDPINQQSEVKKGTGREKGRERSMENLPGPQDRGKAIQQNNGLLCPHSATSISIFSATSASSVCTQRPFS